MVTASIPFTVVKHLNGLMKGIQPGSEWSPSQLRAHADAKETISALRELVKKSETEPAGEGKEDAAK